MDEAAKEFRRRVGELGLGRRGVRYPAELIAAACQYSKGRLGDGASAATIASELGVRAATLERWRTAPADASGDVFKSVTLVPGRPAGLVLTNPTGWRLEGLDVETA